MYSEVKRSGRKDSGNAVPRPQLMPHRRRPGTGLSNQLPPSMSSAPVLAFDAMLAGS